MLAEADILQTIAEISVALAGFAALAGAIGQRQECESTRLLSNDCGSLSSLACSFSCSRFYLGGSATFGGAGVRSCAQSVGRREELVRWPTSP